MEEGGPHAARSIPDPQYLTTANPGFNAPGVTGQETQIALRQYENIFGPAARDIKLDSQRNKRHQRWHLPDALKGYNQYLTDRVDGLITDATNSPFTRNILPYVYLENPDQKLKWNVYSFDEGLASRVPYEAAARVLPQTKRSFAGYAVRQGLAIAMEHNFMVSEKGRQNFKNQLLQLVGSIQLTNDLDVHVALITAPSYQKHMDEKYMDSSRTFAQTCRVYTDTFGMLQKTPNALDLLIEDAKTHLKTWGSSPPTFLMCNGSLTAQLTMIPEKTDYITNGPDGKQRLAQGPELSSYRGLSIINSRKFSMEAGTMPRDLLKRRVRVCQHYYIPWDTENVHRFYEFYDESKDSYFTKTWMELLIDSMAVGQHELMHIVDQAHAPGRHAAGGGPGPAPPDTVETVYWYEETGTRQNCMIPIAHTHPDFHNLIDAVYQRLNGYVGGGGPPNEDQRVYDKAFTNWEPAAAVAAAGVAAVVISDFERALEACLGPPVAGGVARGARYQGRLIIPTDVFILRPNIEHEMLGIIMGRGGTQELGATFWGQTELSCYDDAQHGIWGMSYKYHERAMVTNERNLIRVWDVSFDGYNGGMDDSHLNWMSEDHKSQFETDSTDLSKPYNGDSMLVMQCMPRADKNLPNPVLLKHTPDPIPDRGIMACVDMPKHNIISLPLGDRNYWFAESIKWYLTRMSKIGSMWAMNISQQGAGERAVSNETDTVLTSYHGYMATYSKTDNAPQMLRKLNGTGHLGHCFEGVASIRMGRGMQLPRGPVALTHQV